MGKGGQGGGREGGGSYGRLKRKEETSLGGIPRVWFLWSQLDIVLESTIRSFIFIVLIFLPISPVHYFIIS